MLWSEVMEDWSANRKSGVVCCLSLTVYRAGRHLMDCERARGRHWTRMLFHVLRAPLSIAYRCLHLLVGSSLPFASRLGRRVTFPHGLSGVFVSSDAQIGDDVVILHQVTIGSNFGSSKEKAAPIIANGVLIGAGAKIIGGVTIGQGARVGANALVVSDVAPGQTVVAPAAVVLKKR